MSDGKASVQDFDADMLEGLVETMFLAAHADGDFSDDERDQFARSVDDLTSGRVKGQAFADMLARFSDGGEDARPARLAAIKAKLPSAAQRTVAFSLAVKLVAADGIIRTSERELLLALAEALEIDPSAAADMVKDVAV